MARYRAVASIAVIVVVVAAVSAAEPSGVAPFEPTVSLQQALELATAHVVEHQLDTAGQYLCGVTLRYDDRSPHRGHYWLVQWAWSLPRLGGELSLKVAMDGTVTGGPLGP
jgi:hypothetical protein